MVLLEGRVVVSVSEVVATAPRRLTPIYNKGSKRKLCSSIGPSTHIR